jgi:DNA-binding transcriptional regulator LsrR (DeoR family)
MTTAGRNEPSGNRLDDAARAGWLYYVAGNTQDEIARALGVSRQSAQRLVSLAVSEKLVKVRLDHPIARCMELGAAIRARHGLQFCDVVPSDPAAPDLLTGIAIAGATRMERHLKDTKPKVIALGTGRALRACIEQLPSMSCPQHRIVSLLGNINADGSATPYNAVIRLADKAGAQHYPMALPVLADTPEELAALLAHAPVRSTLALCREADVTFVGVGQIDATAPLVVDGFMSREEAAALNARGYVGEITSHVYDREGVLLPDGFNARVASAPLERAGEKPVIGIASGQAKVAAIRGALRGGLINALITNEATALSLLEG